MTSFLDALDQVDTPLWCLRNTTRGLLLASSIECALDPESRRRGLRGRPDLEPGRVLIAAPCRVIHTMGMVCAIDVAFVDAQGEVIHARESLTPWRLAWHRRAVAAIELPAGTFERTGTRRGDHLAIVKIGPQA